VAFAAAGQSSLVVAGGVGAGVCALTASATVKAT
jgi:hypothetical protein